MTNPCIITCCSAVDLSASYLTERDIPYSCFYFRMNSMEHDNDLGEPTPIEDFYRNIRQGAVPTTSQVNPEQCEAMFESILKEGKNVIHMALSSGIFDAYNSAVIARDEMLECYPD